MRDVPQERYDAIVEEVFDLVGVSDAFDFLAGDAAPRANVAALETRLQEIMQAREKYEVCELACYVRASYNWSSRLPTWQPLVNAAVQVGIARNEPVWDIFYGLVPNLPQPR